MAWSKYDPGAPPQDPFAPTSESGARRVWILRWGWWLSQAMFVLGLLLLLFWGFRRAT